MENKEKELQPIPSPAEPLKAPGELKSLEELYLAATHLEQYRHATFEPADYYLEGLRRDPTDIRLNNGYGLLLYKRGCQKESIPYFEAAIQKQTWKNPNPYHGECYFNLGLALTSAGQEEKAFDAFYKSTWSAETQSAGFYWLACLASRKGRYEEALELVTKSMLRNWHHMKARTLKAALMRILHQDASDLLLESLEIDPLYMGCLYELDTLEDWKKKMRSEAHNYLTLSLDYAQAGLYEDALRILHACEDPNPLCQYYQGYFYMKLNNLPEAEICFRRGEESSPDCCFPNRLEEISILEMAIETLSQAPMAHYYLGNLLYDKKQYAKATVHWEAAVKEKPELAMTWRNLAIAYYNKENETEKAWAAMTKACELDPDYPRFWLEYDQLAARLNRSNKERLERLESHMTQTEARDDLYLRYITLLNCDAQYNKALSALRSHQFHPWEGGEGKVSNQYRYALIQLALEKLERKQPGEALELLEETISYPVNLGEGKLPNVPDHQAHYYMGIALQQLGEKERAHDCFTLAAAGSDEPGSVLYYNDQPSDYIFYQGLAKQALGMEHDAKKAFHKLMHYGEKHMFDTVSYDFFAVSLPEIEVFQDTIQLRNELYCNYLRALGAIGLQDKEKASSLLEEILERQEDYQGALSHLWMTKE